MDQPQVVTQQPPGYTDPNYPQQGYPPQQQLYPPAQQTTTNVVVVQQQPTVKQQRDWNSGLCACFDDCGSLCMGVCCPFWLMVDVSSRMGEGCCFVCCCPGALLGLRIKLRVEQNIQGSLMNDYCAVECCPLCVMCQLSRELKSVGR